MERLIIRAFPSHEENYPSRRSEYFLIDIKLKDNSYDSIESIDFFRKDNSENHKYVQSAVDIIKKSWAPRNYGYTRIVFPVFIVFNTDYSVYDYPFDGFQEVSSVPKDRKSIYVHKNILIIPASSKRRS